MRKEEDSSVKKIMQAEVGPTWPTQPVLDVRKDGRTNTRPEAAKTEERRHCEQRQVEEKDLSG